MASSLKVKVIGLGDAGDENIRIALSIKTVNQRTARRLDTPHLTQHTTHNTTTHSLTGCATIWLKPATTAARQPHLYRRINQKVPCRPNILILTSFCWVSTKTFFYFFLKIIFQHTFFLFSCFLCSRMLSVVVGVLNTIQELERTRTLLTWLLLAMIAGRSRTTNETGQRLRLARAGSTSDNIDDSSHPTIVAVHPLRDVGCAREDTGGVH